MRNNRTISIVYNKDNDELSISWRQNKSITSDSIDDNIYLFGSPRQNELSIHINNLTKVLNKYSWRYTKKVRKPIVVVASIAMPSYNAPLSFRFIEKIKKLIYLLKLW
jgi:hypothetical protein